jgi:hypothetical protein
MCGQDIRDHEMPRCEPSPLEPALAEGHAQLGRIQIAHDWDWKGAEASYQKALELAPGQLVRFSTERVS